MLIYATDQDFNKIVENKLCLVDFYATWCGPCRMLAQELEDIVDETEDFDIVKVDIDETPETTSKFKIDVVPTMIIFKNGQPVKTLTGYMAKQQILEIMKEYI